jgi:hypothetical protein
MTSTKTHLLVNDVVEDAQQRDSRSPAGGVETFWKVSRRPNAKEMEGCMDLIPASILVDLQLLMRNAAPRKAVEWFR